MSRGPLSSPQTVNLKWCAALLFISSRSSHLSSDVGLLVLIVTFSSTQFCGALVIDGPLCLPTCWGVWRDIEAGFGLALILLITGPLLSPQKVNMKGCAALLFISLGPSHLSSDVGPFDLTVTSGTRWCPTKTWNLGKSWSCFLSSSQISSSFVITY